MDLGLGGKVAVVTGASQGIGLAVSRALAAERALVVGGARSKGEAEGVLFYEVDLAAREGPAKLVARAIEAHGGVDILVNNFGLSGLRLEGFLGVSDAEWQAMLEANLMSAVRACRAAIPSMLERGGGAIVNVSSINGYLPSPGAVDYSASKAALANLSKALATEFGPKGIRVNTVSPGPVRTAMWLGEGRVAETLGAALGVDKEEAMRIAAEGMGGISLGRFAEADEVAAMIVLLCSDRASIITGADVRVDGGTVKHV